MESTPHQPRCNVLNGLHQSIRRNEFQKSILHDVFDLAEVGDLPADECPKPRPLRGNRSGNPSVVLARYLGRGH
jgi:hypothetical protein